MELLFVIIGFGVVASSALFAAWHAFGWGKKDISESRRKFIERNNLMAQDLVDNEPLFCRQVGVKEGKNNVRFHFMPSGLDAKRIDISEWHGLVRMEIPDREGNMFVVPFASIEQVESMEKAVKDLRTYMEAMPGPGQVRLDL